MGMVREAEPTFPRLRNARVSLQPCHQELNSDEGRNSLLSRTGNINFHLQSFGIASTNISFLLQLQEQVLALAYFSKSFQE